MAAASHKKHFDRFPLHTKCKHGILSEYLRTWVAKVALDKRDHQHLLLVDAFAGTGGDGEGNPGSPLIMVKIAREMARAVEERRGRPITIDVVLIERHAGRRARLYERIRGPRGVLPQNVTILDGTLSAHADRLAAQYDTAPAVCFIDPFGVKGIDLPAVREFLAGPQREVVVQFNPTGALRLAGAAHRKSPRQRNKLRAQWATLDLFRDNAVTLEAMNRSIIRSQSSFKAAKHSAQIVLGEIYGDGDLPAAIATQPSREARIELVVEEFGKRLADAGAPYLTRLPIFNERGRLQYVMLHASPHPVGRQAMKECYQAALNKCPLSAEAVRRMRVNADGDVEQAFYALGRARGGGEVLWAKGAAGSIADFLIRETDLFPWQLKEVKQILDGAGWRSKASRHTYHLPPLPDSAD